MTKKMLAQQCILDRNLRQTPKEMRTDLIGYHLTTEQIEKA